MTSTEILIDGLRETKKRTLSYFELPESKLYLTYGEGKWCIKEILHHLADAETILYERLRRPLAEPAPVMWGFAQDAWCQALGYRDTPLDMNKRVYATIRDAIIDLAPRFYESHGHLPFNHSRIGLRTIAQEFEKVVWHNENHLQQIENALASGQTSMNA
jgi:hypothetical protein